MRKGWVERKLGDVCTLQRGFDLPKGSRTAGDFPLVSSSGIIDTHNIWKVKAPGVATGRSGSIGNVFYIEDDFWPLNTVLYIKDFHGNDARFVYYLLTQFNLGKFSSGVGVPTLNRNFVHDEIVYIPTSIPEQQRIVSVLDEAFASIAGAKSNAERNLVNARELFETYLQSVFSNGNHWEEKQLGDICNLITDGKHGDCENQENSGYYFLSAKDVKNNTLQYEGARQITKKDFEETHRRTDLKPGDVLVTNSGTIGRMAIAPDDEKTYKTTFQKSVAIIKPIPSIIDNVFCCYHLQADLSKLVNVSAGTAQKNLLIGDLKRHLVKIPPLAEQRAIVGRLEALSAETGRLEEIYQSKVEGLEELKKSVLAKAFDGEL